MLVALVNGPLSGPLFQKGTSLRALRINNLISVRSHPRCAIFSFLIYVSLRSIFAFEDFDNIDLADVVVVFKGHAAFLTATGLLAPRL